MVLGRKQLEGSKPVEMAIPGTEIDENRKRLKQMDGEDRENELQKQRKERIEKLHSEKAKVAKRKKTNDLKE